MKHLIIILTCVVALTSCKKDTEEWVWCADCTLNDIIGHYDGVGQYVHNDNDIYEEGLEAYLQITGTSTNGIRVLTGIVNRFNMNITGTYSDTYYINLGSETQNLSATILRYQDLLRIQLSAKIMVYDNKTESYITREYIDIDMYKRSDDD